MDTEEDTEYLEATASSATRMVDFLEELRRRMPSPSSRPRDLEAQKLWLERMMTFVPLDDDELELEDNSDAHLYGG